MSKVAAAKKAPPVKKPSLKSKAITQPKTSINPEASADAENGLQKLLLDAIKDIYWAENHLVKSLPKMVSAANSTELQNALSDHLRVTEEHVRRLEEIFKILDKSPQAKKCDAMEGLSKEGEGIIESTDSGSKARDHGIIMAAQKVEHYEIASYGGMAQLAKSLGYNEVHDIMKHTLAEEREADDLLSTIAENLGGDKMNNTGQSKPL